MPARPGLYIGSTSYEVNDIETALRHFAGPLLIQSGGTHNQFPLAALPLGEVSDHHWVDEQLAQFDNISAFKKLKKSTFGTSENYLGMPAYSPRSGMDVDPSQINLLYADRVYEGYPIFQRVCTDNYLGRQRLQVGINLIDVLIFALRNHAGDYLDVFIERARQEMDEVWRLTEGNAFFLIETPSFTIMTSTGIRNETLVNWFTNAFAKLLHALPSGAPWGFHFCNGRLGGRALLDQGFTRLINASRWGFHPNYMVSSTNTLLSTLEEWGFVPELVQIPFTMGWERPPSQNREDYEPYRNLYIPSTTQVYAGIVNPFLNYQQHEMLFRWLDDVFGQRVGMSSTCGFGSSSIDVMRYCISTMTHLAYA